MSVGSKALRLAILVNALSLFAGCTLGPAVTESVQENQDSAAQALETLALNDSGDPSSPGEGSQAPEASSAPDAGVAEPQIVESRDLLARDDSTSVGLRVERGAGFSRCRIDLGEVQPVVETISLKNPSRLVVDLIGTPGKVSKELELEEDAFLSAVRIGAHRDRTRLVFDLKKNLVDQDGTVEHLVDTANGKVSITFVDQSSGTAANTAAATATLASASDTAANPDAPIVRTAAPELTTPASADIPQAELPENEQLASVSQEEQQEEDAQEAAESDEASQDEAAEARPESKLTLDTLSFQKTKTSRGTVVLSLTDAAAFTLSQTAPTEYVITIPGASASERTTLPQIAPRTVAGIRSARATQEPNGVEVRMFIDAGVVLRAQPRGNDILVEAQPIAVAMKSDARGQLQTPEAAAAPAVEAADTPQAGAATGGAADDTTARRNPTGIRSSDGSKIYTGRLISLDLQDTDIDNALRIIAEVSNLNIIASDDVSGKVTLRLIDVPWDQALDVILKTNGLDQVTEGNVIRIAPVDKLRQEREALSAAKRAAENLEDLTVQYVRVSYAKAEELKEQIESVLSERGTVATDERTNQLIVKDIKKGHEQAIELIRRLDLRTPQVLLETQIIEGQRNILRDLGFQWNFQYAASPETGNATGLNFPNSVVIGGSATNTVPSTGVNFPAVITDAAGSAISAVFDSADGSRTLTTRLSALETEGKVKIVSRPQVATINNKQAQIKSVETVRVRLPDSGTSIATGSGASAAGGGSTAFEEIDVGIELTVTPQASPDYYVLLDVYARSSTFGAQRVDDIPSTLEREATSTILVKSGQTFALGGVYRIEDNDELQGVPFFKDIPFLGHFFRRTLTDKSDEELIFFITPHIVEGSFDPGSFQAGVL